jgi:drug/metabolite transporter (DMT)-like permease
MTRLRADLLLLLAALIWGTAFVAQKEGNGAVGPLTFVAGRFLLSALLLAPLAWRESERSQKLGRGDWLLAGAIGACMFSGSALQQIGLNTTSVTNAGFITALYLAFVPLAGWLIVRTKVTNLVLAACAVSLAGAWLLARHGHMGGGGQPADLALGDLLVLGSAALFALHIVLVSIFLKRAGRPFFLCVAQYAVCAGLGAILAGLFEPLRWAAAQAALPSIAYTGILSGGIGFTLQIVAQRHTPATEAALIMSMESVFAAIAAALLLGERLTMLGTVGCLMILAGVVMVEALPALPRGRRPASPLGEVPVD